MNKLYSVFAAVYSMLSLIGCSAYERIEELPIPIISGEASAAKSIPFEAEVIRISYTGSGGFNALITSAEEFNKYIGTNNDGILTKYNSDFFETHNLILLSFEETSGSIRSTVKDVTVAPAETDGMYIIRPVIVRIVPEIGTCDMAAWQILISIGKEYGKENCELSFSWISES